MTRKAFNLELPIRSLFESPTIAELAKKIEFGSYQELEQQIIPITRQTSDSELVPISLTQLELWFFNQFYPDNPVYNLPLIYRIEGSLNVPVLEQVFKRNC